MIILITGASHTGKTLLAQKLLEKYKFPYFSIDLLKMGLIRSKNTTLTPEDDDKLQNYLWPIVCKMIKTAIENKQNLIIEGCYIPPNWNKSFSEKYLNEIYTPIGTDCVNPIDDILSPYFIDNKVNRSKLTKILLYENKKIKIVEEYIKQVEKLRPTSNQNIY